MIKLTDGELTYTQMVQDTLVNGKMINSMVLGRRHLLMVHFMKDCIFKEIEMARENFNLLMGLFMKVNLKITIFTVKEYTYGLMAKNMRGNGFIIKCKVMVC